MRRNRAAYLIWLFGCAALYYFENNTGTRALLAASAVLPAVSVLLLFLLKGRASVELSLPEEAEAGAVLTCGAKAVWPSLFVRAELRLSAYNAFSGMSAEFAASPEKGRETQISFTDRCCGEVQLDAELLLTDMLGLIRVKGAAAEKRRVLLRPRLFSPVMRLIEESGNGEGERYSQTKAGNDPGELFGVREYVPGDPVRLIHWKLSQKAGKTMIREFGQPVSEQVSLIFSSEEKCRDESEAELRNALASVLFSASRSLLLSGITHSLSWRDSGGALRRTAVETEAELEASEAEMLSGLPESSALLPETGQRCSHTLIVCSEPLSMDIRPGAGRRVSVAAPKPGVPGQDVHYMIIDPSAFSEDLRVIEI